MLRIADRGVDRLLIDRQRPVGEVHAIVARQACPVAHDPGDRIVPHIRRDRVARAAIGDAQILAVHAREEGGRQGGGEVHHTPVVMLRIADRGVDHLLIHMLCKCR